MRKRLALLSIFGFAAIPALQADLLGPTPYLSFADSPFNPASFSQFYLEDFEDNSLNVPGVTASAGNTSFNSGYTGTIVDSVDADDGTIDGTCLKSGGATCYSWFSGDGAAGVTWTFDASVLGSLPTAAGIVWTDGSGEVTFQAFDENGVLLGTLTSDTDDGSYYGGTAEDRFFGVTNALGISKISLSNASGGIEMDHLQYGLNGEVSPVPEPAHLVPMCLGLLAALALFRRRALPPA